MKLTWPWRNPAEHQLNGHKNALLSFDKHACTDRMYRLMQVGLPLRRELYHDLLQRQVMR